jgi:hypothetical protein
VWEEYKVQVQGEHCGWFEAYEDTILAICEQFIGTLAHPEVQLLWLGSDASDEWESGEREGQPAHPEMCQGVADELLRRVSTLADNEPLLSDRDEPDLTEALDSPTATANGIRSPSPEQKAWLRTPEGQWSRIEHAFLNVLDTPRLRAEATTFGLEPDDLAVPSGNPEALLLEFQKANPGLDPAHPPKDPYERALGVLRMNVYL